MAGKTTPPGPFVVRDPEQLRALAEPLRIRILEAICETPKTTKQVADELGENPTRLYHHVDALEKAGLIRLVSTKPKRGTMEKYYGAVARLFRVEVSLAAARDPDGEANVALLGAEVLEAAAADLRRRSGELDPGEAIFAQVLLRADTKRIANVRRRIERLLADLVELDDGEGSDAATRLTIALYPDSTPKR